MKTISIISLFLGLAMASCAWEEWGKSLTHGAVGELKASADTIGSRLVGGALDTLTAAQTQQKLNALLDDLGDVLARQAAATRDTLLGARTQLWIRQLRDSLLGSKTDDQLAHMREEIIGMKTRILVGKLRDEILGDSTQSLAGSLRDQLLGPKTQMALGELVDTAMSQFVLRFNRDVKPAMQTELTFVQRRATQLLVLASVLACGVVGFVYWQKARMANILRMVTYQIHAMPDQSSYDELVHRIRRKAQEAGLEPHLREVLREQGILGKDAWIPRNVMKS